MKKNTKLRLAALVMLGVVVSMWLRACAQTFGWTFDPTLLLLAAAAVVFVCWWGLGSWRVARFCKRLDRAGTAYVETHDGEAYLRELDACARMPGTGKSAISGMPVQEFLSVLRVRTLREMGRREEALALIKTLELQDGNAKQLLQSEVDQLKGKKNTPSA